jgi:hypothetical protein
LPSKTPGLYTAQAEAGVQWRANRHQPIDSTAPNLTSNIRQLILLRTLAGCYG